MGNCCVSKQDDDIEEPTIISNHPNDLVQDAPGEKLSLMKNDMNAIAVATLGSEATENPVAPAETEPEEMPPAAAFLARKAEFNEVVALETY